MITARHEGKQTYVMPPTLKVVVAHLGVLGVCREDRAWSLCGTWMFIGAIAQRFSRKLDGEGKYMYGEDREENVCTQSNRNKKICSPQRGLYKGQHDMILCM